MNCILRHQQGQCQGCVCGMCVNMCVCSCVCAKHQQEALQTPVHHASLSSTMPFRSTVYNCSQTHPCPQGWLTSLLFLKYIMYILKYEFLISKSFTRNYFKAFTCLCPKGNQITSEQCTGNMVYSFVTPHHCSWKMFP